MIRHRLFGLLGLAFLTFGAASPLKGQQHAGQTTAYETAATWLGVTPRGNVTTNSNIVNFQSDLGMASLQSQAKFQFVIIPSDRKRIQIDFLPYRFSGETMVNRSFRFGGVTY